MEIPIRRKLLLWNANGRYSLNNPRRISFQWVMGGLFVLFSTIPWVHFGLTKMDSQPWPILFSCFFLISLSSSLKYKKLLLTIAWLISLGILTGLIYKPLAVDFLLFRGIANYFGILFIFASFIFFMQRYGFPLKILVFMNLIWLLAGVVQIFFPLALESIVVGRTTIGRGVTSLAPEPTNFAMYLFFNSWLILIGKKYVLSSRIKFLVLLNFVGVIALAQSTMVVLFIVITSITVGLYVFLRSSIKKRYFRLGILALVLGVISFIILINFFHESRLFHMLHLASSLSWVEVFRVDASFNSRLAHVVLPIIGFFHNYCLPGGFYSFASMSEKLVGFYDGYFWYGFSGDKIMSWVGSFLYELGFFGFLIMFLIVKYINDSTRKRNFEIFLLFFLLFSAIPLAFPLIPMIMGALYSTKFRIPKSHL